MVADIIRHFGSMDLLMKALSDRHLLGTARARRMKDSKVIGSVLTKM
jgi:hypothetical protein